MKKALVLILAPVLAHATLTPNLPGRGAQTIQHQRGEVCIIPNKLAGAKYTDKDIKEEQKLCSFELEQNVAVCGKTNSTNPGLNFFSLPNGMTPAQAEGLSCVSPSKDEKIKKDAKYKLSTSCSYTPSLLSYYHVSRFLGDINQVPVAVLRTVDRNTHIAIGQKAFASLKPTDGVIYQTWSSLLSSLRAGQASSKKDALFTDDFTHSYGALQKVPHHDEFYKELFNNGTDRVAAFRDNNEVYKRLANGTALRNMGMNQWTAVNLQEVLRMQNAADMILMDTMLNQADRMGNIAYTVEAYQVVSENGQQKVKKLDELEDGQTYPVGVLQVKKMMMKDNDCGINRGDIVKAADGTIHLLNIFKKDGLLAGLKHFNPETYQRLLKLDALMATADGKSFFKKETAMTDTDYASIKENTDYAVQVLQAGCRNKSISFDLDLDTQFTNVQKSFSCELTQ